MSTDHTEPGVVRITVPVGAIQTDQAQDIKSRILPEFVLMFLEKNRKYARVGNELGSKGIIPDLNRKMGIIIDRVWDGHDSPGEPTREVAMDLIGHLLLMIHMMDVEANDALSVGRGFMLGNAGSRITGAKFTANPGMGPVFDMDGPNYSADDNPYIADGDTAGAHDDEPARGMVDVELPGLPRPLHLGPEDVLSS